MPAESDLGELSNVVNTADESRHRNRHAKTEMPNKCPLMKHTRMVTMKCTKFCRSTHVASAVRTVRSLFIVRLVSCTQRLYRRQITFNSNYALRRLTHTVQPSHDSILAMAKACDHLLFLLLLHESCWYVSLRLNFANFQTPHASLRSSFALSLALHLSCGVVQLGSCIVIHVI